MVHQKLLIAFLVGDVKKIISQFALSEIGKTFGKDVIQNLYKFLKDDLNPSMEGWFLEIWFFLCLNKDGIKIYDKINKETLIKSDVIYFDQDDPPKDIQKPTWLKPIKWNQGGYDAVYIENIEIVKKGKKKINIKFFQITRGIKHSLKIEYFEKLMKKLANYYETKTLNIYFIVPFYNINIFKIPNSKVTGQGLLDLFGWKKIKNWKK
jgi:hypothetical protein